MTDINLAKLHGPALPMKFKVVIKETFMGWTAGDIIDDPDGICVDAGSGTISCCAKGGQHYSFNHVQAEVIQSIGRRDRDKVEVYHGDVLEFDQAGFLNSDRACVRWDILGQNLGLVTRNGTTHPLSMCENGRIIGNHFADKTLMEGETSCQK